MPTDVTIPQLGESVTEGEIANWLKADGDAVETDEILCELETDKAAVELPCPATGILRIRAEVGSVVAVGDVIAVIEEAGESAAAAPATRAAAAPQEAPTAAPAAAAPEADSHPAPSEPASTSPPAAPAPAVSAPAASAASAEALTRLAPAVRRLVEENGLDAAEIPATGRGGRLTKADVLSWLDARSSADDEGVDDDAPAASATPAATPAPTPAPVAAAPAPAAAVPAAPVPAVQVAPAVVATGDGEERVRMTRMRRTIAERLVEAQHTAAILTTFNEVDMSAVMELRSRYKDRFAKAHDVSLGFMSFFARACVLALQEIPEVNASIDGEDIVYHHHVNLGVAASTDRGLVVPVVRSAETMSFADIEREIGRLATLAREGKLAVDDLRGGTFTISNGGIFGSLLSTPILNPPQSGILGMHKIEKRAVVVDDEIVVRPMMYVALSYDHRLIDGREAVTFLVRVKERLEDPARMLLEV